MSEPGLIDECRTAVAGDLTQPRVRLTGTTSALAAMLPAAAGATATVTAALSAAAALAQRRTGRWPELVLDRRHVADAVRSERLFQVDGRPAAAGFAALSRFWPTADGHVRTHANYPWHRAALERALDLPDGADEQAVASALAQRRAEDVEDQIVAAGGVAAAVRTAAEWTAHRQGRAVGGEPLVGLDVLGDAAPRPRAAADLPAQGLRVLDLTRVIAGPVCTRYLGALGADVLRLDPPGHDDVPPGSFADTLLGKRSAVLDFASHRDRLHALLAEADVLVCGYRPGSLDRFGLTDAELADRHPGLVVVRLAAWGHTGPWRHRRGFDSVVQAGSGVADAEATGGLPGALPCQLLDHGTGYLAAAAALDGVRRQSLDGGTVVRRVSLARTAGWLLAAPRSQARGTAVDASVDAMESWPVDVGAVDVGAVDVGAVDVGAVDVGAVRAVAPPGAIDGRAVRWPAPPSRFLADPAAWAS